MIKQTTNFDRFTGIGPIVIPMANRLSNQQEILESIFSAIKRAAIRPVTASITSESPHQVLSILGARGTGKTSLLLSLIARLRADLKIALIPALLMADQLRDNFPVVPALVGLIEESVEDLLSPEAHRTFRIEHTLAIKKLSWATARPELLQAILRDSLNLSEWNAKFFDIVEQPLDLPRQFKKWVTAVLDVTESSVLVIPIDDTDISLEKADEIIDVVRVYLAHPRIVVVLASDFDSLERRIRNLRLATLPNVPELPASKDETRSSGSFFGLDRAQFVSREAVAEQEYVASLLIKVLPPATRHHIRPIPESSRVAHEFFLPGAEASPSIANLVANIENQLGASTPLLSELLLAHPDLLSENLRKFANQYALISGVCASYSSESKPKSDAYEFDTFRPYIAPNLSSRENSGWTRVRSREAFRLGRFRAQVVQCLLASNEFQTLDKQLQISQRVKLGELVTLGEIASAVIEAAAAVGTRSEPSGARSIYTILSVRLHAAPESSLIDFCVDYAIRNGADIESLSTILNVGLESISTIRVPIPNIVATVLREAIGVLSDKFFVVSNPRGKSVGGDLFLNANRDVLAPIFLHNSLDLGVFIQRAVSKRSSDEDAIDGLSENDESISSPEAKASAIERHIYHAVGTATLYAFFLVDAAVQVVTRNSNLQRSPFFVEWTRSSAWVLHAIDNFHSSLATVFEAKDISASKKMELMCFVADFPLEHMHNSIPGVSEAACNRLRSGVIEVLDDLTNEGLLAKRRLGTATLGVFVVSGIHNEPAVLESAKLRFPSISIQRRVKTLREMIKTLTSLSPTETWDFRTDPPPTWHKLASDCAAKAARASPQGKQSGGRPTARANK